jgi:hypothetical protein
LIPTKVSIVVNGRTYTGQMKVEPGRMTVSTLHGQKSLQIGGSPPEVSKVFARMLLRELVQAEIERKDPRL